MRDLVRDFGHMRVGVPKSGQMRVADTHIAEIRHQAKSNPTPGRTQARHQAKPGQTSPDHAKVPSAAAEAAGRSWVRRAAGTQGRLAGISAR